MSQGIWVDENTYLDFSESPSNRSLSDEIASRQSAWDYSGMVGLLPDPDQILAKRGDSAEVLEGLTADDHLISVIQQRKVGTLRREIKWQAGTEIGAGLKKANEPSAQAEKLRDDLVEDLKEMDIRNIISQILDAPLYGYVPLELSWKPKKGRIALVNIQAKPHRWFGFDEETNAPKFISQAAPWDGEDLPYGKFVFARHFPTYDNPYGLRLLSRCFWPVTFKRGGLKFWVTFAEKFGIPFMLGRYPKGTNTSDQADMLSKIASMVQSAVAVLPEGSTIEKISSGADSKGSSDLFAGLVSAMEKSMSKVIVGQTLTSETSDKGGSYSQGKVHEDVLKDYQDSDQMLVKNVLEQIAKIYGQINSQGTFAPQLSWFEEEDPKKDFALRDVALNKAGVRFSKKYYQRQYRLQDDDFEIAKNSGTKPPATAAFASEPTGHTELAGGSRRDMDQQEIDNLATSGMALVAAEYEKNEAAIVSAARAASSYEEAFENILELFPAMPVSTLSEALEAVILNGEMFGGRDA